jgi:hypothetical protein
METKASMKKRLMSLIRSKDEKEKEMKDIVRDYLVMEKRLPNGAKSDGIHYKKIMREDFGLVI